MEFLKKVSSTFNNEEDVEFQARSWLMGVLLLCRQEDNYEKYEITFTEPRSGNRTYYLFELKD